MGKGPFAAAPPACAEQTATAMTDGNTPQTQSLPQPALKRGRYEADVECDDRDDDGDMSGDLEHDFDFSLQGGAQQYAQQSTGACEQQGQAGDQKASPYVMFFCLMM